MQDAPDAVVDGDIVLVAPGIFLSLFLHTSTNPTGAMKYPAALLSILFLANLVAPAQGDQILFIPTVRDLLNE